MARNGSGTYVTPNGSWTSGAVNGSLATLADWQALIADLTSALTQSVSKDGQTTLTGNLNMGGNKLTNMAAGTGTGQTLQWQQLFDQGTETELASAATTDIGAQNTNFLQITGTTTITSFGTTYRGPRFLRFASALILTNSSTLVCPGGVNITTAAGDVAIVIPGATTGTADKWVIAAYQTAASAVGGIAYLAVAQSFTKAQRGAVVALTDGATITPDFSLGNNFSVTLGGNRTLASPTNLTAGQHGSIVIAQDATGSRTLAYGSSWKFSGGTAPTATTTANAVDVLAYYVESSTRITAKLITDVK